MGGETASVRERNRTFDDIPKAAVNIKLHNSENITAKELMKFKSELNAQLDMTKEYVADFRGLKQTIEMSLLVLQIIMIAIIVLLFILIFYQVILQTDANIRDNLIQIGILRAIGLKKEDVFDIIMVESFMNVMSAVLLGFVIGHIQCGVCIQVQAQIFEIPSFYNIDWNLFFGMVLAGFTLTYIATKVAVIRINKKQIASILKMK